MRIGLSPSSALDLPVWPILSSYTPLVGCANVARCPALCQVYTEEGNGPRQSPGASRRTPHTSSGGTLPHGSFWALGCHFGDRGTQQPPAQPPKSIVCVLYVHSLAWYVTTRGDGWRLVLRDAGLATCFCWPTHPSVCREEIHCHSARWRPKGQDWDIFPLRTHPRRWGCTKCAAPRRGGGLVRAFLNAPLPYPNA